MTLESSNAISAYNSTLNRLKKTPNNNNSGRVNANDFTQIVKNFAESAVEVGKKSETQSATTAAGKADLNSVIVTITEAELTLNTIIAVHDKVLEAYREILRIPI